MPTNDGQYFDVIDILVQVAAVMAELTSQDALAEDQAHSLIASAVSARARSLLPDAWQQVTAVLQNALLELQEAARVRQEQQQLAYQAAADQVAELHQPKVCSASRVQLAPSRCKCHSYILPPV